jgi:hypothetical protein
MTFWVFNLPKLIFLYLTKNKHECTQGFEIY